MTAEAVANWILGLPWGIIAFTLLGIGLFGNLALLWWEPKP